MTDFAQRNVTLPDPLAGLAEAISVVAGQLDVAERRPGIASVGTWTFDRLRAHLVEILEEYAAVADGRPAAAQPTEGFPAAFAVAAARARAAFGAPGYLTTVAPTPIGPLPGAVVVQHVVNELVSHAWDLGRAVDEPVGVSEELADRVRESWAVFFDVFGRPDFNFGPEQPAPAGAPAIDRLAAFLGRQV